MERSGENIWSEIQAKCRVHLESGEPIRTLVRETPNWIVAVEPTFIRRRSEDASTTAGESNISKAMILGIWDSLVRTGESQYTGPYRFAWALVGQLIEGIGFEREPFRLVFRDREQAMKPFHDEASTSSAATPNHIEGQHIVAVYVPDSAQTNLRVGLEHGSWGFKETRPDYEVLRPGDFVVLATGFTGGSPRVQPEEWIRHQLREVIVGRLTSAVYESHEKVWPDEGGDTWYPHRFMFDVALREQDVELAGQQLGPSLAEALRRSAIQRGGGYVCPVEGSLLGRVGALDDQAGPAAAKSNDTAPEGSQPVESIAVEPPLDTSVWWVNQGKTYRLERDRGLVWAPQKNKQGRSWFYWTNVSRLRAGHVTLHYAKGAIRALGLVTGNGRAASKPADMPAEEWEADGWTADVTYFELDAPIALEEVTLRSSETGSPFGSDGAVKQGYLFAVSDPFVQQLREAHADRWPAGSPWEGAQPLRYWLFQANPATWDIDGYLAAAVIGDEDTWTASRYHKEMTPGDKVLLWKSGRTGGVVGTAEITGSAELVPTPDWRDSNGDDEWRVPIRLTGISRPPLMRHDVAEHPVLKDLDVLRFPQATNYHVTPQQWETAMALLSSQPKPLFDAALVQEEAELRGLVLNLEIYASVIAALLAGKHIVLTGPPGTAKTTLAEAVAAAAERAGLCAGYVLSTATSDWTTFETVGGLRPRVDGTLEFAPGQFVKAIQGDRWLIVDEFNRSNFDRAFGQLFTLLSGQSVSLPYENADSDLPIVLALEDTPAARDRTSSVIVLRKSWRLLATMNVFDKSLLFEMSFALMRRFAFIEVSAPDNDVYRKIVASELEGADIDQAARIQALLETFLALRDIKELGPALFLDMARFARERLDIGDIGDPQLLYQLFYSYLLPQFEGIDDATGDELLRRLSPSVERSERLKLRDDLKNVLGVELRPPRPVNAPGANEALDDTDVDVDAGTTTAVDGDAE